MADKGKGPSSLTNAELEAENHRLTAAIDDLRGEKRALVVVREERALARRQAIWETAPDGVGGGWTGAYEPQWYDDRPEDVAVEATTNVTVVDADAATAGGGDES